MASLYERLGPDRIRNVITEFYRRAETDGIIGHFFFNHDVREITEKQIAFATAMLGGPKIYKGRPLQPVHENLILRKPHFDRRQVLMAEVLDELSIEKDLKNTWLELEERLRPLIVNQ